MAGVIVPANKGKSVKNKCYNPKINAMTLKMENYHQKPALAAAKQLIPSRANFYINRAGKVVNFKIAPISKKKNQEKLLKDSEDVQSIEGVFEWKEIEGYYVPYIIRVINGEELKFISVRMAETQLLSNYLHYLHADIYTYASVKSYFITDSEAKLLNDINKKHSDSIHGKDKFYAGKDYIVRLEDVLEFYTFIKVCCNKIVSNITPDCIEKCGFICINSEALVPYCLKDDRKYFPLFYFEGITESMMHLTVKLEDWNLAYLQFLYSIQGIKTELHTNDICTAIAFDDIKDKFPQDTRFEDYWPAKLVNKQKLTNQKSIRVHPSGIWIRTPPEVPAPESTISHSLTASAPVVPQSMPVVMNTFKNGWPPNRLVNSYTTPDLPPQTTCGYSIASRNQSIAAQCYNAKPQMSQGNSQMNGSSHVIPPLSLNRANNTVPAISNTVSYSNTVPISQCMTIMYNPVPSSSVMSHSNQMQQFYIQRPSNNSQAQQQQVQQHQQQLQQRQHQPQQLQQIIITPQVQPYSGPRSVMHGRLTNTQQRNAIKNVAPVVITRATEIIDLSSPPSSPAPTPVQDAPLSSYVELKFKRIPEHTPEHSTNNAAYMIYKASINRRLIHSINFAPYIYADLLVTVEDLVQTQFFSCTISRCAYILYKYLNVTLFRGNSEQLNVLRGNGRIGSTYSKDTPMVFLKDIIHAMPKLRNLVSEQDQQYQSVAGPSKRHRTS
ncbi:hypothetical protein AGLY_001764 [Aphis glycines]|uniref:Uncharacterized protein n=1 Tax=Aphis glycines TaxID=307491 RepID=A0A6G0U4N5_APHGL|nr:hypothetical protein AGLY_001764 [Aphis glycines]